MNQRPGMMTSSRRTRRAAGHAAAPNSCPDQFACRLSTDSPLCCASPSSLHHLRREPATRHEALRQREDLAIVWLHLDGDRVTEARHCVVCQPHGPVIDGTGARLRRLAGVLAAVTCGLLASAAIVPAAFARVVPDPGGQYGTGPAVPVPAATVRVVTAGGMAGWQITLIALGAALFAAAAAVLFDRALSARRAASATT